MEKGELSTCYYSLGWMGMDTQPFRGAIAQVTGKTKQI